MPCLKAPVHHERLILIPYPTSSHISHHFGGDPVVKLCPVNAALSKMYLYQRQRTCSTSFQESQPVVSDRGSSVVEQQQQHRCYFSSDS